MSYNDRNSKPHTRRKRGRAEKFKYEIPYIFFQSPWNEISESGSSYKSNQPLDGGNLDKPNPYDPNPNNSSPNKPNPDEPNPSEGNTVPKDPNFPSWNPSKSAAEVSSID